MLHKSVLKWDRVLAWDPKLEIIWHNICRPYCSTRKKCFLWQVMYDVPTTNHWRFPRINRNDPATWCMACPLRQHEDLIHLLWNCPPIKPIWNWIANILRYAIPWSDPTSLSCSSSFIGYPSQGHTRLLPTLVAHSKSQCLLGDLES